MAWLDHLSPVWVLLAVWSIRARMRAFPVLHHTIRHALYITNQLGAEHAENHCQMGNLGLALAVMADWLDSQPALDASP